MKKFLIPFFLVTAAISPVLDLKADDSITSINIEQNDLPFQYSWFGDEDNLYFVITAEEGTVFPGEFGTYKFEGGQGCRILCGAAEGAVFKGGRQSELTISVEVNHDEDEQGGLPFTIISQASYIDGEFMRTRTVRRSGKIENPPLDADASPDFIVFSDEPNTAAIGFKNSR